MFKNVYEIEYLVGKKIPSSNPFVPYDKIICDFLASFSKELTKEKKIKNFPELKSLSFLCR